MRNLIVIFFVGLCEFASAGESDKKRHNLNEWHPNEANYKIHSGGTAYSAPPTKTDSVITIAFRDEAARQVFEQIGPDVKNGCDDEQGKRTREKKGVYCTYTARLENPANSHYRCWIGINLRSGDGDMRLSC